MPAFRKTFHAEVVVRNMRKRARTAMQSKVVPALRQRARQLSPVRTGFLRNSVNVHIPPGSGAKIDVVLRAEAYYASYVMSGTPSMKARPFLDWAIRDTGPLIRQTLADAMDFRL